MLPEFLLRDCHDLVSLIENDGARRRRSLIDGQYE
jgi:hypothetical protein